ncbi:MAG: OmpH family outer membrane protein [Paludibacteraceae bacterium]|nr:OmpH family outer membrane protein [Paludibacteraceae bacterium]
MSRLASKIFVAIIMLAYSVSSFAQFGSGKIAVVDVEYILKNMPMYESANEQVKQITKKWQTEVEQKHEEARVLQKNYQTEVVFLSDEMKKAKEKDILAKEKEANDLARKYFGPDGELYKKKESLMKPIQDEVYVAVKDVAEQKGYTLVLDKASTVGIMYFSAKIDISDEVLSKLGYTK